MSGAVSAHQSIISFLLKWPQISVCWVRERLEVSMSEIVFEREHLYVSISLYLSSYSIDSIFLLFPFLSLSYPSFSLIFSVSITLTHSLSLCRFASVSYLFITLSFSLYSVSVSVSLLFHSLYIFISLWFSL